jgi:hypothetical protein
MSSADSEDRADELTERYRAASAGDPARPSDAVRQSILAHAGTVAMDHARQRMASGRSQRPAANDSSWRVRVAASVIVAGLATVLAWRSHSPTPVPAPRPNPSSSSLSAHSQSAARPTVPTQPAEPVGAERRANTAPAPNAVTAHSRQRTDVQAETPRNVDDAAANLEREGASAANSRQALASVTEATAAERAASGSAAAGGDAGLGTRITAARTAAPPAAPPSRAEASRSPAPTAAASARPIPAPDASLVTAAESGNLERVEQLLRSGISPEQTDARGRTALLIATLRGDVPMVRRLLASGARADVVAEDGDTPLAAARRRGPPELVRMLEQETQLRNGQTR